MILHSVYLHLAPDFDRADCAAIMDGLAALVGHIDGFSAFDHGPNIDVEAKSPEAPYGFVCTFADRAALARYADDPRHQMLGGRLVALCGGAGNIKVYDLEVTV